MFEVRHLFNYTPSHARLAFSRLRTVGMSAAPIPRLRNYPRTGWLGRKRFRRRRKLEGEPI
jgi:hypothetical protein